MGNRLSRPKGVDGMSEGPITTLNTPKKGINPRLIMAPLAAFTMAGLVFLYTRSSIRAAKINVQRRREEGGGQIDWGLESQRNHGLAAPIDGIAVAKEAILGEKKGSKKDTANGKGQDD